MNIVSFTAGFVVGFLLGIIPGLHPNLVIAITLSTGIGADYSFYIALVVANIMFDSIPSSLFGVAESGRELSIHESHVLAARGMSWYASMKSAISAFKGFFISSVLFIPSLFILTSVYSWSRPFILPLLIIISGLNIILDGRDGIVVFFLSSLLGVFSFLLPISSDKVFMPLLTGLFAMPYLVIASDSNAKQTKQIPLVEDNRGVARGSILGLISNFLPSLGPSQIAFLASFMPLNFLSFSTSLSASSSIFAIATAISTGKARAGTAVPFLGDFLWKEILEMPLIALVSASMSMLIISYLSWPIIKAMSSLGNKRLSRIVAIFLVALTYFLSGIEGLLILVASTSLGLFAMTTKARKTQLLGSLIYPTIMIYAGLWKGF